MAKSQENAMIIDNKKQDLNEIADDRVNIVVKMDDDDSDQPKPKNILHDDHAALAKAAENENTSKSKVVTRYVDVQECMVKYLRGEDIVMDLQLASGAMIQITKPWDEDVNAEYRPVRVIGRAENVDKAENLIKALIDFVDVGGYSLLFKDYDDNDCYGTRNDKFRHGRRRSLFSDRPYGQRHSRWPVRRFRNGRRLSRSPGPYVRYSNSSSEYVRDLSSGNDDSYTDSYSSEYDSDDSYTDSYSSEYDSDNSYRRRRSPSPKWRRRSPSPWRPNRFLSRSCFPTPPKRPYRSGSRSCSFSPSPKRPYRPHSSSRFTSLKRPRRSPSPSRPNRFLSSSCSLSPSPKRPYRFRSCSSSPSPKRPHRSSSCSLSSSRSPSPKRRYRPRSSSRSRSPKRPRRSPSPGRPNSFLSSSCSLTPSPKRPYRSLSRSCSSSPSPKRPHRSRSCSLSSSRSPSFS